MTYLIFSLIIVDNHFDFQPAGGKANFYIKLHFYTTLSQSVQLSMLSLNIPVSDCHNINVIFCIFYLF